MRRYREEKPQAENLRRWRQENSETLRAYRELNREERARKLREWKLAHPEEVRQYEARRRSRKRGNGTGERYSREEIAERDSWICGLCGESITRTPSELREMLTVDHIIPLAVGGEDARHNLQAAHFRCNSAKGARVR